MTLNVATTRTANAMRRKYLGVRAQNAYLNVGEEKTIGTLHGCYSQFLIEKNVPGICREFPPSLSWKIVVKWIAVGMQRAEVYGRQESINLETDKVSIRSRDERSSGIRLCATISAVHKRRR